MKTQEMSINGEMNMDELDNIAGGYAVTCTDCGKTSQHLGKLGVTAFYLKHGKGTIWLKKFGDAFYGSHFWA